jgi:predicted short-subunit dehydrogenase-like oxidoreductase (DUF2520 family)
MYVPTPNSRIGFIGAGQLATPLAWNLARAGYRIAGAAGRSRTSAERLTAGIHAAAAYGDAQRLADAADLVFIAVPDDAIAAVATSVRWQERHGVVHCSGATEVAALAPAAEAGASIGGFHPMHRADVGTVERHLAALSEKAPALLPTYLDIARRSLAIAEAKGGADRAGLESLRELLDRRAGRPRPALRR